MYSICSILLPITLNSPQQMNMERVKGTVDVYDYACVNQGDLDWKKNKDFILKMMPNNFFRMTRQCLLTLCNCSVYGLDSLQGKPLF